MRNDESRQRPAYWLLCGVVSVVLASLLLYSQTMAFAWDEGFHLLAAQLILGGKKPYLDFVFSQTPLNAYWNAGWMAVFGDTWRTAHAVAAVMTAGAILLSADFLFRRFPVSSWRPAAAIAVAAAIGMNAVIVDFGTIGQAYALCLFLIVAAFRFSVEAVDRPNLLLPGLAGLLAGAAASSSLLTAPVAPVLLLWMAVYNRAGNRWAKLIAFCLGVAAAFLPLLRLFLQSPRQVVFGVIDYNFKHRGLRWETATEHNIEVYLSWIDFSQALLLLLLALSALFFLKYQSDWTRERKAEFYLCAWLAAGLGLHISTAHPTFQRYYLLLVPFLAILAAAGLYWLASRLYRADRPVPVVLLFAALLACGLGKALYEERDEMTWKNIEEVTAKVQQVTPPQSALAADEHIYFLTRRRPPSGMELRDSHKLEFPKPLADYLHVIPESELDRQIRAGVFHTVQVCSEDRIQELGLDRLFLHKAEFGECGVFWDRSTVAK